MIFKKYKNIEFTVRKKENTSKKQKNTLPIAQ